MHSMELSRVLQFLATRLSGRRLDATLAVLALLLVLLPARVLTPWTNPAARLLSVPLAPLTHAGMYLRDRIRPPRESFDARAPEVIRLESELAQYRTLYEQSRLERERLERSMAALQAVSTRAGTEGVRLAEASVIASDPTRADATVRLNAGERHGVRAGAPVFVDGDIFAGIVANDVGAYSCAVIPASKLSGIGVRLYPAEGSDAQANVQGFPGAVLKPLPNGNWTAEVASTVELREGLIARLADERYPRVALGTRVGIVVRVEPIEQVPLARRIEVRRISSLADAASVIVAITPQSEANEERSSPR